MKALAHATVIATLLALAMPAQAEAPIRHELDGFTAEPDFVDDLGWRVGFLNSGLFGSGQGRPFIYFDTGLRLKNDEIYVDIKTPLIAGGIDFLLWTLATEAFGDDTAFNFFETFNEPIQYGAFLEAAMLRLGPTIPTYPFANQDGQGAPLRLSFGLTGLADFVFFDLLLQDLEPEEFEELDDPSANDPAVLAFGGFVSMGGDAPLSEYDFAIGVAYDVFTDDRYVENNGLVVYLDFEWVIGITDDVGAYIRTRFSTYTHISVEIPVTALATYGVVLRL